LSKGTINVRTSFFSAYFSITLVLLILGTVITLVLFANKIRNQTIQNFIFEIEVNEKYNNTEPKDLIDFLNNFKFTNYAKFYSKKDNLDKFIAEFGEDIITDIDENPLPASIVISFKPEFVTVDSLQKFDSTLTQKFGETITSISFDSEILENLNANIKVIAAVLLAIAILLTLISSLLIFNIIKISLYTQRFLIRSMQLVGATKQFIRQPYLNKSLSTGIMSALTAFLLLFACIQFIMNLNVDFIPDLNFLEYLGIGGVLALTGISISWFASFTAVNRYLKVNIDKLF
jgi:cell division transport system permease protein